jgi:hypothetical protein
MTPERRIGKIEAYITLIACQAPDDAGAVAEQPFNINGCAAIFVSFSARRRPRRERALAARDR